MKNKTILFASIAIAVFLLVVGTGVVTSVMAKNKPTPAAVTADVSEFMAREQSYQQLLNEANQKISLANQQITELASSVASAQSVTPQPYLFNSNQASQIAGNLSQTEPVNPPELVDFSGVVAYEVIFDNPTVVGKVYVDANTGEVLFNGLQQVASTGYISTEQAVALATNYLGGGTVVQVGFALFDGEQVYIVQFMDGQSVYVSLTGKILAVQMAPSPNTKKTDDDDDDDDDDD